MLFQPEPPAQIKDNYILTIACDFCLHVVHGALELAPSGEELSQMMVSNSVPVMLPLLEGILQRQIDEPFQTVFCRRFRFVLTLCS